MSDTADSPERRRRIAREVRSVRKLRRDLKRNALTRPACVCPCHHGRADAHPNRKCACRSGKPVIDWTRTPRTTTQQEERMTTIARTLTGLQLRAFNVLPGMVLAGANDEPNVVVTVDHDPNREQVSLGIRGQVIGLALDYCEPVTVIGACQNPADEDDEDFGVDGTAYVYAAIKFQLDNSVPDPVGAQQFRIRLHPGDTAWNPASPERPVYGPGVMTYTRHADGGIDGELDGA